VIKKQLFRIVILPLTKNNWATGSKKNNKMDNSVLSEIMAEPDKGTATQVVTPEKVPPAISSDIQEMLNQPDKNAKKVEEPKKEITAEVVKAEAATEVKTETVATEVVEPDFDAKWKEHETEMFGDAAPKKDEAAKTDSEPVKRDENEFAKYQAAMANPRKKAAIELILNNGDIVSAVNKIKGVNVDALSGEQLIRMQCEELGVVDADEIQIEIDAHNALSPMNKKKAEIELKSAISDKQSKALADYSTSQVTSEETTRKNWEQMQLKLKTEIDNLSNNILNKQHFGVKADPGILQMTRENIDNTLGLFNKDGSINAERMFHLAFVDTNLKTILNETAKKFGTQKQKEELIKHSRPDANQTTAKPSAVVQKQMDGVENFMQASGADVAPSRWSK
jgi:hypothetical protein